MLSTELEEYNCKTYHTPGDADLLIVQKAIQSATTSNIVLVGEDSDLIVLLCYHASLDSHNLFFCLEPKKNTKKLCVHNIRVTKEKLGQDIWNNILFIHAILVCDITSCHYGIGKEMSLSKFSMFREQAKVFPSDSAPTHDVIDAGEKALVLVYNGMLQLTDTLHGFPLT